MAPAACRVLPGVALAFPGALAGGRLSWAAAGSALTVDTEESAGPGAGDPGLLGPEPPCRGPGCSPPSAMVLVLGVCSAPVFRGRASWSDEGRLLPRGGPRAVACWELGDSSTEVLVAA